PAEGQGVVVLVLVLVLVLDSGAAESRTRTRTRTRTKIGGDSAFGLLHFTGCFRNSVFKILPAAFRGNAAREIARRGTLKSASFPRTNFNSACSSSVLPSSGTTNATGCSPRRASGWPMTAASFTSGNW